jgi:two-component system CheB/CheR fusion protein
MESSALRVVLADDHKDTATSMFLRMYGYEVEIAADGLTALQAVQARSPDVVLLDIGLPKMNGWQVARQIRALNGSKRPLLIAISGYGTLADRLRSQEAGIDLHLVKPVDIADLDELLRRATDAGRHT